MPSHVYNFYVCVNTYLFTLFKFLLLHENVQLSKQIFHPCSAACWDSGKVIFANYLTKVYVHAPHRGQLQWNVYLLLRLSSKIYGLDAVGRITYKIWYFSAEILKSYSLFLTLLMYKKLADHLASLPALYFVVVGGSTAPNYFTF